MQKLNCSQGPSIIGLVLICLLIISCEDKPNGRVIPYGAEGSVKAFGESQVVKPSDEDPFGDFKYDPYYNKSKSMLLQVVNNDLRFDENYNATYHFTLKNNLEKPTVAFKLIYNVGNGIELEKKYKVKIKPGNTYSNLIRVNGDDAASSSSYVRVANVILQGGEMIDIAGN